MCSPKMRKLYTLPIQYSIHKPNLVSSNNPWKAKKNSPRKFPSKHYVEKLKNSESNKKRTTI